MPTTEQLNAALAGRYVLEHEIGAGGMATVYVARDIRHHRKVALKVLSPELGAILGPERFLGEIEVTANLHHPHLLPLFDSGEIAGLLFYVMPYVEGETLRARLQRERQLTVDEAVRIACAIASALDYAHRHRVIHRDLKPENILLQEGEPLVMDFGIALAVSHAGGARITQTGLSLGTPQYMSPEQATGDRAIDGRSDIYSLAAITYEMLVGDPPHVASTVQAVLAKVITDIPASLRASRPSVPDYVDAAVLQGLSKLPADRFSTAGEFAAALKGERRVASGAVSASSHASPRAKRYSLGSRYREALAWAVAVLAVVTVVVQSRWAPAATPYGEFQLTLPESVSVWPAGGTKFAMSSDGSRMVFVGLRDGDRALYVRRADDPVVQVVRGTDSASSPTFSPDGQWLLFNSANTLRKIPVGGGTPQKVADSSGYGSWGDDNRIVFVRQSRIYSVASDGSAERLVGKPDSSAGIVGYNFPEVLPGSKYALISYWRHRPVSDSARVGVISLSDGRLSDLGLPGVFAHYVNSGYILFGRPGGLVFAVPFSGSSRSIRGAPTMILDGIAQSYTGATDFAVSNNGMLIHHGGASSALGFLVIGDTLGRIRRLGSEARDYRSPRLSPDGAHVAVQIEPPGAPPPGAGDTGDLWILDVASGTLSRVTTSGANFRQEWSADGTRLVYIHRRSDSLFVISRASDGTGGDSVLYGRSEGDSTAIHGMGLGPTHGFSVVRTGGSPTFPNRNLHIAPTENLSALRDFVVTKANEVSPQVSPDGRAVVYQSDETGRPEIYIRPVPGPGPRVQVSAEGGIEPRWSRDGKTVYYRTVGGMIAAAVVKWAPVISVPSRRMLFSDVFRRGVNHAAYDVLPNQQFLFVQSPRSESNVMVSLDWLRLMRDRKGASGR